MDSLNQTLIFISTHLITKAVISEYNKMKKVKNCDVILAIDNTNMKAEYDKRITQKKFFGTAVECFFFDSKVHDELQLPWFKYNSLSNNFGEIMWYNSDYRFYYIRQYFPDYEYYWQFEYDIYCNGDSYQSFFDKYSNRTEDALLLEFRTEIHNGPWYWSNNIDWIYKDIDIYHSFFPIVKLTGKAIDFLYQQRLKYKALYHSINKKQTNKNDSSWIYCECFVPTELVNNAFSVYGMTENNITLNEIDLTTDRLFENPDNKLYHPIKGLFIERLNKLNNEIKLEKDKNYEFYNNLIFRILYKFIQTFRNNK